MRRLTISMVAAIAAGTLLFGCQPEPQPVTARFAQVLVAPPEAAVNQRWLDAADRPYADKYRRTYSYSRADVTVNYDGQGPVLRGRITARNLKPNFAYRLCLLGLTACPGNEPIGLTGAWRQEVWDGHGWNEAPLPRDKGAGLGRSSADEAYFQRVGVRSPTSPTAYAYRFTGCRFFGWFVTDSRGGADVQFPVENSWRSLWHVSQRAAEPGDGKVRTISFPATASNTAYSQDGPAQTIGIYPEWERRSLKPAILLPPGLYLCRMVLIEESFHGRGDFAGGGAVVLSAEMRFRIVEAGN